MIVKYKDNEIPSIILTKLSEKEKLVIELLALDDECVIKNSHSPDRDIIETLSTHLYYLYEKEDFKKYDQVLFYAIKEIAKRFNISELQAIKQNKIRQLNTDSSKHEKVMDSIDSFGKSLGIDLKKIVDEGFKEQMESQMEILQAEEELTNLKEIH